MNSSKTHIVHLKRFFIHFFLKAPKKKKGFIRLTYPFPRRSGWLKRFVRLLRRKTVHITILDKRQRFAAQTLILTTGILVTQFIWTDYRFALIVILALATYILTYWSLKEDIRGIERLILFLLPVGFTISVSFFYFLLPQRMFVRIAVAVVFAIGTYAILLAENIYNVAAERSIQLLRVAQTVGFLLTLIVVFLSANIVYALRLPFYFNGLIIGSTCFILSLQSLWTVNLEQSIEKKLIHYSFIVGLIAAQLAITLSFWPTLPAAYSLLVTASYYCLVGLFQQYFSGRLFGNMVREYIAVFLFILVLTVLTTRWG